MNRKLFHRIYPELQFFVPETPSSPLPASPAVEAAPTHPSFGEAFKYWLKLGFINFGGPTGQIAIMHTDLVEKKRWVSETRFLHALNFCMLLPGPEAQQLATYIGWLLHGTRGGIVAGALFVLPGALLLWLLAYVYMAHGSITWIAAIFYGLQPAVVAIVANATMRLAHRALKNYVMYGLAIAAFVALFFFKVPFPWIIGSAAFIGIAGGKILPKRFVFTAGHASKDTSSVINDAYMNEPHLQPSNLRFITILLLGGVIWWVPVLLVGQWAGFQSMPCEQGVFFGSAALVTFGGAYAVLEFVKQHFVFNAKWISAQEFQAGMAQAETTPGPLIMVLQFVGFAAGWHSPLPGWSPFATATLCAAITTWTTFVPSFIFILLGAPYIEKLRGHAGLSSALSAITAAVVGVIANMAVWFAQQVLFPTADQAGTSWRLDGFALAVALVGFLGLWRLKWDIHSVVIGAALMGLVYKLILH